MSLIDSEKRRLYQWSLAYDEYLFPEINDELTTYFDNVIDDDVLWEYDFTSVQQLQALLAQKKETIHDKSVDLICTVATFKYRNEIHKKNNEKKQVIIPDFIYNF